MLRRRSPIRSSPITLACAAAPSRAHFRAGSLGAAGRALAGPSIVSVEIPTVTGLIINETAWNTPPDNLVRNKGVISGPLNPEIMTEVGYQTQVRGPLKE